MNERYTFSLLFLVCVAAIAAEGLKLNIVFLLADDMGYGELGSYGQERIETPFWIVSLREDCDLRIFMRGVRFVRHRERF